MFSTEGKRTSGGASMKDDSIPAGLLTPTAISFISHEVGNPVSSLKGFLEIVLDGKAGPLTALQAEFLGLAKLSTNRLCRIIDDIADLGLLARGLFQLEVEATRLGDVTAGTVGQLGPLASSRHITLENLFPSDAPICYVDAKRMGRVLVNLVGFMLQFSAARGRVVISGEALESKVLWFVVGGESAKIPAEYTSVLSPDCGDGDSNHRCDAMWLGLTVARRVVEHHGGEVWLDGQPGGAARICLSLPIGECSPEAE